MSSTAAARTTRRAGPLGCRLLLQSHRLRPMKRTAFRAAAIVVVGGLVAIGVLLLRGSDKPNGQSAAATCPVTIPNGEPPPGVRSDSGWHGKGRVRTTLPLDGKLVVTDTRPPPPGTTPGSIHSGGAMSVKFLWWLSRSAGQRVAVRGRRQDRSRTDVLAKGRRRLTHLWPSRLRFPGQGCWRVTGRAGRAKLAFVLDVSVYLTAGESVTPASGGVEQSGSLPASVRR